MSDHVSSTTYIQDELNTRLEKIAAHQQSDIVTLVGPINDGLDSVLRIFIEAIDPRAQKLTMILETQGGYIEVTELAGAASRPTRRKSTPVT